MRQNEPPSQWNTSAVSALEVALTVTLWTQFRIIFIRIIITIVHAVTEIPGWNAAIVVPVWTLAPARRTVAVATAD